MIKVMGGRSLKLLFAFLTLFLHLKPALGFTSGVGNGRVLCIEKERQALLEFKKGFVNGNDNLSFWDNEDGKDCCNWVGVYCNNQTGHVLGLYLHAYGFRGMISPSLLELPYLTSLDLSGIDFNQSHIPKFIGSLGNLKFLDLSSANLSGPIPHQLGNLSLLQYLHLDNNDFNHSHIPKFIGSLGNLKSLDLSWANLSGPIPHQLGNLSLLQYLHLDNNDLKIVENLEWLSRLSSIEDLDLSSTNLSVANDWLKVVSHLPKLSNLNMAMCDLPPITDLSSLPHVNFSKSLTFLDLSTNHVTQTIFPWLFNYSTSLVIIDLSDNQLGGSIPDASGNMNSLDGLTLDENQLEGGIPKFFGNMCALHYLSMKNNKLSEVESINNLSGCVQYSLQQLCLDGNQLKGSVPKSIGNLSALISLLLGSNLLEGEISDQHFSNLSKLEELSLSHNSLTFKFSNDWVPPFQLYTLNLSFCNLGPDFPKWLRTQQQLYDLDISHNGISDTIPSWFWYIRTPFSIDLSYNQIKGMLPNKPLNIMYILNLSNNKFSGILNDFFCSTLEHSLIYLDLSNNQLSGGLDVCFSQLPDLGVLNLANNNLSGQIPDSMGSLKELRVLDLSNNSFLGELPLSLQNCRELTFINLRDNSFSGKLPSWMGESLLSLIILDLHSNKFHGCIPLQLCRLAHIQFFDLSQNNISGNIPRCLYNLTAMAFKNMSTDVSHMVNGVFIDGTQVSFRNYPRASSSNYVFNIIVSWKGHSYVYGKNFGEMRSIDLSSNKLTGEIPAEIFNLIELKTLNLTGNMLTGLIPQRIGRLKQLESLDLSRNQLSGSIPASIADLNFLSFLNLSYNKLSGRIPTGTQIQIANPSGFIGNLALCGPPLTPKCPGDVEPNAESPKGGSKSNREDEDEFLKCLYIGMGLGFMVGLWGVCGSLMLNRSWRHLYFRTSSNLNDWLYVAMIVNIARLQRMFQG